MRHPAQKKDAVDGPNLIKNDRWCKVVEVKRYEVGIGLSLRTNGGEFTVFTVTRNRKLLARMINVRRAETAQHILERVVTQYGISPELLPALRSGIVLLFNREENFS